MAFTTDRRLAVIAGRGGFVVWNSADGELVFDGRPLDEPSEPLYLTEVVTVSSDGGFALAGDESKQTVDVWDLRAGRRIHTLHGHPAQVRTIRADASFSTIVTGDHQGNVRVWGLDWDYEE
ncbi:WD40 repeat domain-containing protein [Mangrovihabitans endophyticus]|nr:hypothetical protein [Mangrovihabitans endophyticus]